MEWSKNHRGPKIETNPSSVLKYSDPKSEIERSKKHTGLRDSQFKSPNSNIERFKRLT